MRLQGDIVEKRKKGHVVLEALELFEGQGGAEDLVQVGGGVNDKDALTYVQVCSRTVRNNSVQIILCT